MLALRVFRVVRVLRDRELNSISVLARQNVFHGKDSVLPDEPFGREECSVREDSPVSCDVLDSNLLEGRVEEKFVGAWHRSGADARDRYLPSQLSGRELLKVGGGSGGGVLLGGLVRLAEMGIEPWRRLEHARGRPFDLGERRDADREIGGDQHGSLFLG